MTSYHHHPPFRLPPPWAHHPWGSGGVWCRGIPTAGRYLRVSWSNKLDGVRRHWVGNGWGGPPLILWVPAILEPFVGMGDTSQTPPGSKGEWPSEWSAPRGCHLPAQQCAPPPLKSAQALARAGGFPRVYLNTPPDPQSNRASARRKCRSHFPTVVGVPRGAPPVGLGDWPGLYCPTPMVTGPCRQNGRLALGVRALVLAGRLLHDHVWALPVRAELGRGRG